MKEDDEMPDTAEIVTGSVPDSTSKQTDDRDLADRFREVSIVFLDLFDTLIEVDGECLPKVPIGSHVRPSTAPFLYEALRALSLRMGFEEFVEALHSNQELILTKKERLDREISATTRFEELVRTLSVETEDTRIEKLGAHLARVHMEWISRATRPVEHVHLLLDRLKKGGRSLYLLSNFDHAPAVNWILDRHNLADYFTELIISEEIGVRKPSEEFFKTALTRGRCRPEHAFHIGDDPVADVWGAERVGIPSIWINSKGIEFPRTECRPTGTVARLSEIMRLL